MRRTEKSSERPEYTTEPTFANVVKKAEVSHVSRCLPRCPAGPEGAINLNVKWSSLIQRPEWVVEDHAWPAAGAGVDIALGIDAQELRSSPVAVAGHFVRDERLHPAGLDVADANASFPTGIPVRIRHAVGDVNMALIVDGDRARLAELGPTRDEVSILVDDLNALIAAVRDVHVA